MKVSFVIVAYNSEKQLPRLLENLVNQDYDHSSIEVILVDGNSSDCTKMIMNQFALTDSGFSRVIVKDNPKRTLPCGWNIALAEVKCNVVIRVDAHAQISKDFISLNIQTLAKGESICGGKVLSVASEQTPWEETINYSENSMFGGSVAAFRRQDNPGYVSTLAFAAYKTEVFKAVGGYDERLDRTEDNEMHQRMREAGFRFYSNPSIISYRDTRNTFGKLLNQKYKNGYWIGLTFWVSQKAVSIYHLIPLAFIIAIITTCFGMAFGLVWPAWILWGCYLLCNIAMSLPIFLKKNFTAYRLLVPFLFFSLHISYGIGALVGFAKAPVWKSKHPKQDHIRLLQTTSG
jgi:glycosyltransferase involved in cell wall biosynthesis